MTTLLDFVPAGPAITVRTVRGMKATATKREKWAHLLADPAAMPAMLQILQIGERRGHALRHAYGCPCQKAGCTIGYDRAAGIRLEQMLKEEQSEAESAFCLRFRTSLGYVRRFRTYARQLSFEADTLFRSALSDEDETV